MQQTSNTRGGFTLVELAIVMVIIGLLIGGILQGAALIQSSKVNRTIADIQGFNAAILSYREKYNALPGDHLIATTQVPGCNSDSFCENGDGNLVIAAPDMGTDIYNWQSILGTAGFRMEASQLWKHLALAGMITGVDSGANPTAPGWGSTHPASPIGGGYEIFYDASTTVAVNPTILRISAAGIFPGTWQNLTTPTIAAMIDRKIDDGDPNTGKNVVNYGSTRDDCKISQGGAIVYNETSENSDCTPFTILFR